MDTRLEMRSKIGAVFEQYAVRSEYYRNAHIAQRIVMQDSFYWLIMKLLGKIIGPFEGMEPRNDCFTVLWPRRRYWWATACQSSP